MEVRVLLVGPQTADPGQISGRRRLFMGNQYSSTGAKLWPDFCIGGPKYKRRQFDPTARCRRCKRALKFGKRLCGADRGCRKGEQAQTQGGGGSK